jgi:hypothetical protein
MRVQAIAPSPDTLDVRVTLEDYRFDPTAVTEGSMWMGGSRELDDAGFRANGTYELDDFVDVEIDHDIIPSGYVWKVYLDGMRASGLTLVPEVYNVTAAAVAVTGADFGTSFSRQTLTIPSNTGKKIYRIRYAITGATVSSGSAFLQAQARMVPV